MKKYSDIFIFVKIVSEPLYETLKRKFDFYSYPSNKSLLNPRPSGTHLTSRSPLKPIYWNPNAIEILQQAHVLAAYFGMEYVSINCVTSPPRTNAVSLTKEAKRYRTTAVKVHPHTIAPNSIVEPPWSCHCPVSVA